MPPMPRSPSWSAAAATRVGVSPCPTWEHSYVNILGLGAAVRQALDLGLEVIGQRAAALGARLRDQLADLPGVTIHDLGQNRCAIVTAKINGLPAVQAAEALARAEVNVSTTVPEHNPLDTRDFGVHPLIRFSPHLLQHRERNRPHHRAGRRPGHVTDTASAGSVQRTRDSARRRSPCRDARGHDPCWETTERSFGAVGTAPLAAARSAPRRGCAPRGAQYRSRSVRRRQTSAPGHRFRASAG